MTTYPQPTVFNPSNDALGEGPVWDFRTNSLVWVDITGKRFHIHNCTTKVTETFPVSERVGFLTLTEDPDILLLGLLTGFTLYRLSTETETLWLHPEPLMSGKNRLNDGKVDPCGRCVAGTMDLGHSASVGSLYTLIATTSGPSIRSHDSVIGRVAISNGLDWSDDGNTFYYVDSLRHRVEEYRYNLASGEVIGPSRTVCEVNQGFPDGMTMDAQGRLWLAVWDASEVLCIDPGQTGESAIVGRIPMPVARPSATTFGGDDLGTLFITTAKDEAGVGGDVYSIRIPGVSGRRTNLFRLTGLKKS
eukprot:PhF_6_TR5687/c0_g1_i1/m.8387